jgi:hypothetical protein
MGTATIIVLLFLILLVLSPELVGFLVGAFLRLVGFAIVLLLLAVAALWISMGP